jgi:hypothetical protein
MSEKIWRKSSRSNDQSACVEIWRKSSRSDHDSSCVELAFSGEVRDSKNPAGPTLRVDLGSLLTHVKRT